MGFIVLGVSIIIYHNVMLQSITTVAFSGSHDLHYCRFLFAWVFPVANVTVITGIYMAFGSLMLCGSIAPFTYRTIYKSEIKEHISAWLSPNRFFVEGLTVGEYRTLPAQSGFTVDDASVNFDRDKTMMRRAFGYAMHDPNATIRSLNGYYNGM